MNSNPPKDNSSMHSNLNQAVIGSINHQSSLISKNNVDVSKPPLIQQITPPLGNSNSRFVNHQQNVRIRNVYSPPNIATQNNQYYNQQFYSPDFMKKSNITPTEMNKRFFANQPLRHQQTKQLKNNLIPFGRNINPGDYYIPSNFIQPNLNLDHNPRYHYLPPFIPVVGVDAIKKQNEIIGVNTIQKQQKQQYIQPQVMKKSEIQRLPNINYQIKNEQIFCVICSRNYPYDELERHIQSHKNRLDKSILEPIQDNWSLQKIQKISSSKNLNPLQKDNFHFKPIVQPQQFNVQYNPSQFVIEKNIEYRRKEDGKIVSYGEYGIGTEVEVQKQIIKPGQFIKTKGENFDQKQISIEYQRSSATPYKVGNKMEPIIQKQIQYLQSNGKINKKQIIEIQQPQQLISQIIKINLQNKEQAQSIDINSHKPNLMKRKFKKNQQIQVIPKQEVPIRFDRDTFNQEKQLIPEKPFTNQQIKKEIINTSNLQNKHIQEIIKNQNNEFQNKQLGFNQKPETKSIKQESFYKSNNNLDQRINSVKVQKQNQDSNPINKNTKNQQPLPLSYKPKQLVLNQENVSDVKVVENPNSRVSEKPFQRQSQRNFQNSQRVSQIEGININTKNIIKEMANYKKKKISKQTLDLWN